MIFCLIWCFMSTVNSWGHVKMVSYPLPHCSWASLPEAVYLYLAYILLPLTVNCSSLISGIFMTKSLWKNVYDAGIDLGTIQTEEYTSTSFRKPIERQVTRAKPMKRHVINSLLTAYSNWALYSWLLAFILRSSSANKKQKIHYANTPLQYTAIFHGCKNVHFQMKFFNIFLIFAQNIDCGYTLEPPQWGSSNAYHNLCFRAKIRKKVYPCKPKFYYLKVGCKGVFVTDLFSWWCDSTEIGEKI